MMILGIGWIHTSGMTVVGISKKSVTLGNDYGGVAIIPLAEIERNVKDGEFKEF